MSNNKIPRGLRRCKKCGEYKGRVREKDLPEPDLEIGFETQNGEGYFAVLCLCDGILCPRCHKNKIHKPISNSYDPETNQVWHWPYFTGTMGCGVEER